MCFALKRILLRFDLVKEKVAVATVKGKAYFLIVNQLQEHCIPFLNLVPGESVPSEIKVVITTEKNRPWSNMKKFSSCPNEDELDVLLDEVKRITSWERSLRKNNNQALTQEKQLG